VVTAHPVGRGGTVILYVKVPVPLVVQPFRLASTIAVAPVATVAEPVQPARAFVFVVSFQAVITIV